MMGRLLIDNSTGEQVWQHDDGQIVPIEEPGLIIQAGRQMADLGSGVKMAYGTLTENEELVNEARLETQQRNRAFAGADEAYPWQSMIGQAIPGLVTAPITGGASLVGQLGTNIAIGAAESALDVGQGGTALERGVAGGVGGLLGDLGGRAIGRIMNMAKGLAKDIRVGRGQADNPLAREAEDMGLSLTGSQRAAPGSEEQRILQRMEQGAESSMFTPGLQAANEEANQALLRGASLEAMGLPGDFAEDLGPETLRLANARISEGFGDVAAAASQQGPIPVGDELAGRILNTRGQIKELRARGRFQGLDDGILSGNEWTVARRALAADAANAAGRGEYELADDIFADVEALDRIMEGRVGDEVLQEFASLREQYRNLKILSKQGVIKADGGISIKNLNRALQSGTGYGTTAKQGLETVNPQSKKLIDLARVGSSPEFQPFRSSGTAENLSAQRMAGMALDPTEWLSLAGEAIAPAVTGATSRGGGRAVTGALTPAPVQIPMATGAVGRSMLDEALYPFVGADDDRRP